MIAIIERLADDFSGFAPELVASPKASMYRIYRDVRFSENKAPYKTHVLAYRAIDHYVSDAVQHFLRRRHKVPTRGTRRFAAARVFGEYGVRRETDPGTD